MSVRTDFERLPKPTSISAYFDVIRFWLKDPLDRRRLSDLQYLCSGGLRADTEPAKFAPRTYHQRITLRQPSDSALKWLNEHCADAFINYVEIAIDWGFHDGTSRDDTFEFFLRHFCRRHHGRKQQVRFYADGPNGPKRQYDIDQAQTRYDAGRSAPNRTVFYREEVSRQTGEIIPLLHTEWRTSGVNAVKRLGICSAADLVRFDHHGFWARRLLLLDASPGRLGRFIHNCKNAKKSRVMTPVDRKRLFSSTLL
jgi:hypothetical protein